MNGVESTTHVIRRMSQRSSTSRTMSAEMRDNAEETIIDFITCPICRDYIHPPSASCENGHFMCGACKIKIQNCATCRTVNFPNKKNIIFDSILREIYYPCSYQENGCADYFKYSDLKEHQKRCDYQLVKCVFASLGCIEKIKKNEKAKHEKVCHYGTSCRIYWNTGEQNNPECAWRGFKCELLGHIGKAHEKTWMPHCLELGTAFAWMLPISMCFEKIELIELKDAEEMFYFYSKCDAVSNQYIAIQYIGDPEKSLDFMFSVVFTHEFKKVRFENVVVPPHLTKEDVYKSGNCFQVHYEFFKKHFMAERVIDCYLTVYKTKPDPTDKNDKLETNKEKLSVNNLATLVARRKLKKLSRENNTSLSD